jgi:putative two-component system response regulator
LREENYRILDANNTRQAFELLRSDRIDLILLDSAMSESSGLKFCRAVKASRDTRTIPVLMMAAAPCEETEIACYRSGADQFLAKPLCSGTLRARIRTLLRHKRATDSLDDSESILLTLARAMEHRDRTTSGHGDRLATLCMAIGTALGLPHSQILVLNRGGYLHDIGKIGIPDSILFKPGPLTADEWAIMRTHSAQGEEICRPAKTLAPVLPIIRHHHERMDGTGYPDGLRGDEIPLLARILSVADVFDALTSTRPYKAARTPAQALAIVQDEARCGWRDPEVVEVFTGLCSAPSKVSLPSGPIFWPTPSAFGRSLENLRVALERANDPVSRP